MIEINNNKMLAEWTIAKGFSSFDREIDSPTNYLTKSQVNYVQNAIKEEAYYQESNRLKLSKDSKSLTSLQKPTLDEPSELDSTAQNVADFLKDVGCKLDETSEEMNAIFKNLYSMLSLKLNEIDSRKPTLVMISELEWLVSQLAEGEALVLGKSRRKLAEMGDEYEQMIDNLKSEIADEPDLYSYVKEVKDFIVVFSDEASLFPELLETLSLSMKDLNDTICAFEKGEVSPSDLIASIEKIEAKVSSYNRTGYMFRFNPMSNVEVEVEKKKVPILDAILQVVIPLKLKIGSRPHLLNQLNAVGNVLLRFNSISNTVLRSYAALGQELIVDLKSKISLIKNRIVFDKNCFRAKSELEFVIDAFTSYISDETFSKKNEITRVFLRQIGVSKKEEEETPWKKWNPRQYLLCEQLNRHKEKKIIEDFNEIWKSEDVFQMDDIRPLATRGETTQITPNAIVDLNLSRPGSSITRSTSTVPRQDSVVTVQEPLLRQGIFAVGKSVGASPVPQNTEHKLRRPIAISRLVVANNFQGLMHYMESTKSSTDESTAQEEAEGVSSSASSFKSVKSTHSISDRGCFGEMDDL